MGVPDCPVRRKSEVRVQIKPVSAPNCGAWRNALIKRCQLTPVSSSVLVISCHPCQAKHHYVAKPCVGYPSAFLQIP